ncbi:MAG: hypothetical protein AB7D47_04280 [Desulfovibrio sp.]|jgi:hypothetical protein
MYGLFNVPNPADRAGAMLGGAQSSFANMQQQRESTTKTKAPGPTVGGAVTAGIGGAAGGAMLGETLGIASLTPGIGAAVLAPLAMGAYLLG